MAQKYEGKSLFSNYVELSLFLFCYRYFFICLLKPRIFIFPILFLQIYEQKFVSILSHKFQH